MPTTRINAYTTPEGTALAVTHEDLRKVVEQMMHGDIMFFANSTERTAVFTALGVSPRTGAVSHLENTGAHEKWNGTAWYALVPTSTSDTQNTAGTTTSTGYTATLSGGTACGVAFEAPASGKVIIHNACAVVNSGASHSLCTIRVRTGDTVGAGSDVVAASDDSNAVYHVGTNEVRAGISRLVTGLTAGADYNVQQLFRVSGNTGTFTNKHLIVQGVA